MHLNKTSCQSCKKNNTLVLLFYSSKTRSVTLNKTLYAKDSHYLKFKKLIITSVEHMSTLRVHLRKRIDLVSREIRNLC